MGTSIPPSTTNIGLDFPGEQPAGRNDSVGGLVASFLGIIEFFVNDAREHFAPLAIRAPHEVPSRLHNEALECEERLSIAVLTATGSGLSFGQVVGMCHTGRVEFINRLGTPATTAYSVLIQNLDEQHGRLLREFTGR